MAKKDSFEKWAASLTAEQMRPVLVELAEFAEEAEMSLRAALAALEDVTRQIKEIIGEK